MTTSAISGLQTLSNALALTQGKGSASDGVSPPVEAAESPATKQAETSNGGIASKGSLPTTYNAAATTNIVSASSGGINKLV